MLLICLFYAAGTPSAFALKAASPEEIAAIQKQMHVANKMDAEVKKADLALYNAKTAKAGKTEIIKLERMLALEKNKQSAARTVAIHMTIVAYGLEPANPRGTSVVPLTNGRTIAWLPVAREREGRHIQDAAGESKYLAQPRKSLAGKLYPDGVAYIYPEAFQQGVGYLASTILHERIHFEQSTTAGKGDKLRRAELEVEALQAEKDNERHFFDPNDPADLAHISALAVALADEKSAAAEDKKERAKLLNRLRAMISPSAPLDMFESKMHTNAELADIRGLVAEARGQADRARHEREARSHAAAEKTARLDHDARLRIIWTDLARRSCANPGSVTQAELDGLQNPYQEDFQLSTAIHNGLDLCGVAVYQQLARGMDAEELRRKSTPVEAIALQPAPQTQVAPSKAHTPFSSALPRLRNLAVRACNDPRFVTVDRNLLQPHHPYLFSQDEDDRTAGELSVGLGACASRLFHRLIAAIRAGEGGRISAEWVEETAAAYSRESSPSPIYTEPPGGGTSPPPGDGRGCEIISGLPVCSRPM